MILALDSAPACTGWALLERVANRELIHGSGVLRGVGWRLVRDFVARVVAHGKVELVVIEDAYLGSNVATLKGLCRLVGRWEQEFQRAGIRTRMVMASEWQRGMLSGLIHEHSKSEARRAASILWVRAEHKMDLGHDECAAICMGTWVARKIALNARAAAGRHAAAG